MNRQNILISMTVQFPNPLHAPQWGAPVLLTQAAIVVDAEGKSLYQPAFTPMPAAASDITDELLAQLSAQMAVLGLQVGRIAPDTPIE